MYFFFFGNVVETFHSIILHVLLKIKLMKDDAVIQEEDLINNNCTSLLTCFPIKNQTNYLGPLKLEFLATYQFLPQVPQYQYKISLHTIWNKSFTLTPNTIP